ncbi:hypothetical protein RN001_010348 [Aquatica leii]|uniref:Fatty acyl-CoA reductase n=1 Tax=Aquatica leii TaxID=1421715 RepID=A0AAN7P6F5_9COLE|nr:hypothetical protein RN001_010348 [Aquatica leii]
MRAKKNKSAFERLDEYFDNSVYDRLKTERSGATKKVAMIPADLSLVGLGMSESDRELLKGEVDVVFHTAASVRFDETLRLATDINIKGTQEVMNLCLDMKNLTSVVYVSTAYSNCIIPEVEEVFYRSPIKTIELLNIVDSLNNDLLNAITPTLLGIWPNTYVFTKSIAEDCVKSFGCNLPVTIVRPSIIIGSAREPAPGWVDNYVGATGVFIGAFLGVIRTANCEFDYIADLIPVDYVVNCLLVAASKNGKKRGTTKCDDIPIYNCTSSFQNPVTWRNCFEHGTHHAESVPTPMQIWHFFFIPCSNKYLALILHFLLHIVPAYVADFFALCLGKKRQLVKSYEKISKFLNVLSFFSTRQWIFHNIKTQELWNGLNEFDKKLYNFDVGSLNWNSFFYTFVRGGRQYLLKDSIKTKYFTGSTVFITGSTGFIGKLLVEKLLRTCRDIKRIYLLIRQKKQDDPYKRLEKLFDDCVFDKVRNKESFVKITTMNGDLSQKNLGLSQDDIETLISEVSCVFHVGATVRFNEEIREATFINIRATWDLLDIAKKMKNLKSFVHVSTAFSFCIRKVIDEVKYQSKVKAEHLVTLVEALDEDELGKITPVVLGKWPNTYTFTKAIAEDLIVRKYADLPLGIARPSIVSPTAKEPLAGWTDTLAGLTGLVLGREMGVLHVLKAHMDRNLDVVPADYVVNNLIAVAWDVGTNRVHTPSIYNYVSSCESPANLLHSERVFRSVWEKIPPVKVFSYPFFVSTKNDYVYLLLHYILHIFFGYIYDCINIAMGKRAFAVKRYKKLEAQLEYLTYFTYNEWTFTNFNTQRLFKDLSVKDQQLFNFDMSAHSWDEYSVPCAIGLRVYLLKDPLETVPQGLKRWRNLKILHYSIVSFLLVLVALFSYLLWVNFR